MEITNTKKQYVFNFAAGGWNTVWASNEEEARQEVLKQFATFEITASNSPRTINIPDVSSIRILTEQEEKQLKGLFW